MHTKERFKILVAVYLVPIKDGKVLLSRRFNTGYMDGMYGLVSGHVEQDEPIVDALIRETKEEAGITIEPESIRPIHVMYRKCPEVTYMDMFFVCYSWKGNPSVIEPEKCDDMRWHDIDKLPSTTLDYVQEVFKNFNKGVHYSEFGFDK